MADNHFSRRRFITGTGILGSGFLFYPAFSHAEQEKPKPIDPRVVNEFVKVAHADFDRMKTMLEEHPLLLNSSWDWGGGDFETAIGAAGHMGHKDFAHYLIGKGARYDIFVLTMLGKTRIVKAMLDEYPALLNSKGPHGFTLLHHAEKGGEDAKELADFILSKGLKEKHIKLFQ